MTAGEGDRRHAGLTEREAALLAILREAAAKGEPCPTNLSLAFGAGYRNPSTMAQVLGKLAMAERLAALPDAEALARDRARQLQVLIDDIENGLHVADAPAAGAGAAAL